MPENESWNEACTWAIKQIEERLLPAEQHTMIKQGITEAEIIELFRSVLSKIIIFLRKKLTKNFDAGYKAGAKEIINNIKNHNIEIKTEGNTIIICSKKKVLSNDIWELSVKLNKDYLITEKQCMLKCEDLRIERC